MPCDLCDMIEKIDNGSFNEPVLYSNEIFICVYCRDHPQTPMTVSREHTATLEPAVREYIRGTMGKLYSDRKPRGTGMTKIKEHWHEHWI